MERHDPIEAKPNPAATCCPQHPFSALTNHGCVMCSGEQNAARDRKLGKGKPRVVMAVADRAYGM